MSRRNSKQLPKWGHGKHRGARIQRFNAKHPKSIKGGKRKRGT